MTIKLHTNFTTTLYKRNKNNKKIQEWTIEINEGQFRTKEGYSGGKITTNDWTTSKPKNVGKKSETTAHEQATKEANAKIVKKRENAYTEDINEVDNVEMYFEPMLAHPYKKFKGVFPVISQPKLDGVRDVCKPKGMFTRKGKEKISVPHIHEALKHLFEEYPDLVIDGELYNHKYRDDFNKITSLVGQKKPTAAQLAESKEKVEFHVYDVCFFDNPSVPLESRIAFLQDVLRKIEHIVVVDTQEIFSQLELDAVYSDYMLDGFEGQMVRACGSEYENKRSNNLLKRKEFIDEEFILLDVEEGKGNWAGKGKKVYCGNLDGSPFADGKLFFKAGIKGNMEYCTDLLVNKENYKGKQCTIRFQEYTRLETGEENVPRFGVMYGIREEGE